ncbi:MAG: hypothetical protein AB8B91_11635 [Rubripirellula sp.]
MTNPFTTPPESVAEVPIAGVPTSGRPSGVTVFAILAVLFGGLGILGLIGSLVMFSISSQIAAPGSNPVMDLMNNSPAYRVFMYTGMGFGAVFSVLLLIGGIGLFKMKSSARKMLLAYAIYSIVAGIITNVVNYIFVFAPMLQNSGGGQGASQAVVVGSIIGGIVGGLIGLILPIAILVYFNLGSVKDEFRNWDHKAQMPGSATTI